MSAQRECHGSSLPHQFDVLIFQVSLLRIGGKKWIEKSFCRKTTYNMKILQPQNCLVPIQDRSGSIDPEEWLGIGRDGCWLETFLLAWCFPRFFHWNTWENHLKISFWPPWPLCWVELCFKVVQETSWLDQVRGLLGCLGTSQNGVKIIRSHSK